MIRLEDYEEWLGRRNDLFDKKVKTANEKLEIEALSSAISAYRALADAVNLLCTVQGRTGKNR